MIPSFTYYEPAKQNLVRVDAIKIQDRVKEWIDILKKECPILDGVLLEDIDLTGGTAKQVTHKLNRAWRGVIVVRASAASRYSQVTTGDRTKFLSITATDTTNVDLWVF